MLSYCIDGCKYKKSIPGLPRGHLRDRVMGGESALLASGMLWTYIPMKLIKMIF